MLHPYAALPQGKDLRRHLERTPGDYGGLGIQVDARNGWITVIAAMRGSPAECAGIRTGDQLIEVNGLAHLGGGHAPFRWRSTLNGGGGLAPDVILDPDPLTAGEARLVQALQRHVAVFRDILSAYALELRRGSVIRSESFEVTAAMRQEVRRRLAQQGIALTDSIVDAGARLLDDEIGYEIRPLCIRAGCGTAPEDPAGSSDPASRAAGPGNPSPQQLLGVLPNLSGH